MKTLDRPPPRRVRRTWAFAAVVAAGFALLLAPPAAASPECPDFVLEPTIECPGVPPEQPPPPPDEWMEDAPPGMVPPEPPPPPAPPPLPATRCVVKVAQSPYWLVPDNIAAGDFQFTADICLDSLGRIVTAAGRDGRLRNMLPANKGQLVKLAVRNFTPPYTTNNPPTNATSITMELFFLYDPPGTSAPDQTYSDTLTLFIGAGGATVDNSTLVRIS